MLGVADIILSAGIDHTKRDLGGGLETSDFRLCIALCNENEHGLARFLTGLWILAWYFTRYSADVHTVWVGLESQFLAESYVGGNSEIVISVLVR